MTNRKTLASIACAVLGCARPGLPAEADTAPAAPQYRVVRLDMRWADRVNNGGQVLGYTETADGTKRAVLWQNGKAADLDTLCGRHVDATEPTSVNEEGIVQGWLELDKPVPDEQTGKTVDEHRFAFDPRAKLLIDLDAPGGIAKLLKSPMAASVRTMRKEDGQDTYYDRGKRFTFGDRFGSGTGPAFINAAHTIGGDLYSQAGGGSYHTSIWRQGTMTDIAPPEGYDDTNIRGLNDRGQALVLASHRADDGERSEALLWVDGRLTPLPTLGGNDAEPYALNAAGQAVGSASYPAEKVAGSAVFWDRGRIYDLNRLIAPGSGWKLHEAFGMNDRGWIVGEGRYRDAEQAFLLIPLPNNHDAPPSGAAAAGKQP